MIWRIIRTRHNVEPAGYCTNTLDVELCDALDTYSALEKAAAQSQEYT